MKNIRTGRNMTTDRRVDFYQLMKIDITKFCLVAS